MKYDRYVHIILRDGKIKAVLTSASAAHKAFQEMRDNAMPAHTPEILNEEWMRNCMTEHMKWRLETWAVCKTIST